jgi:hypothetical protein
MAQFRINTETNSILPLTARTFGELGFKERSNLQEWIAKEPSCLGEELLVIQKEFSGFSDTHERLDLLALDKQGSLVLIENKLDDTGRDVTCRPLNMPRIALASQKKMSVASIKSFSTRRTPALTPRNGSPNSSVPMTTRKLRSTEALRSGSF